tara:strand:+ start:627 stop:1313 length:687 start_codon:yes stop_codon:yes gene_type:complete
MIKCAIMQPTYLPWSGYFNLVAQVDVFVFLDDAQFQKNSWHNRNRILVNNCPYWITAPVNHKALSQTINKSLFDDKQNWKQKHVKLLRHTYSKHPFSHDILPICDIIENYNSQSLADLNVSLIKWIMMKLDIKTECFLSSELNISGKRTERIINILKKLNADVYLSPQGAAEYLDLDDFSIQTNTKLTFQSFENKVYEQYRQDKFESHLSIVDVVANIGWENTKKNIT